MKQIKVLASCCSCNQKFVELVKDVVKKQGIEAEITVVNDVVEIMNYNVMSLPALVIDENVVARGNKTETELIEILKK